MKSHLTFTGLLFTALGLFLSSCTYTPPTGNVSNEGYLADFKTGAPTEDIPITEKGYWDGDGVSGSPLIKINIAKQQAYFYKGNQLVGQTSIATGKEGKRTPKGTFKVTQKSKDHKSSLSGVIKDNATGEIVVSDAKTGRNVPKAGQTFVNAPMPNFLRFNGAIGMHTGHLPGYPASHGCVRLPNRMAEHFYENARLGTPVIVE